MSKTKGIPERPKPPTFELMAQDVENAPNDDVVFFEKSRGNVSNAAMVESYMNVFSSEDGDMRTSESDLQEDECERCSPEVERTYQQVLNLMEVQKKLQTAPTVLQENYERLQNLGLEILESVKDLEQSSSNVLKSTES